MEARCRSIAEDPLDATDIGAIILDSNFEIAWCNETTADFFGIDPAAVIGRDRRRVLEDIADIVADSGTFTGAILAAYEDNTYTEQFECHVPPGDECEERWLVHRSHPIETGYYEGGRFEYYIDITGVTFVDG